MLMYLQGEIHEFMAKGKRRGVRKFLFILHKQSDSLTDCEGKLRGTTFVVFLFQVPGI